MVLPSLLIFFSEGLPLAFPEHGRRSEASASLRREGKLELTKAPRSKTVAAEIPEGFHSAKRRRTASGGQ